MDTAYVTVSKMPSSLIKRPNSGYSSTISQQPSLHVNNQSSMISERSTTEGTFHAYCTHAHLSSYYPDTVIL